MNCGLSQCLYQASAIKDLESSFQQRESLTELDLINRAAQAAFEVIVSSYSAATEFVLSLIHI